MSYQSLLAGLVRHDISFVVVGGVAAVVHGSARVTNDLDICYDASDANVERLTSLLAQWSAYPRGWEPGLPFFMDPQALRTTPSLTLRTSEGDIDVLEEIAGVGSYVAAFRASTSVSACSVAFRVLDLDALIRSKRATTREKDLAQLPELEALRALRRKLM